MILLACIDPWPEASHDQIGQVQSYSPLVVCRRECAVWTKTLPEDLVWLARPMGPSAIGLHRKLFSPQKLQPESVNKCQDRKTCMDSQLEGVRLISDRGQPHFHGLNSSA